MITFICMKGYVLQVLWNVYLLVHLVLCNSWLTYLIKVKEYYY